MAIANHSSSKRLAVSRGHALALGTAIVVLAGCSGQSGLLAEGLRLTTFREAPDVAMATAPTPAAVTPETSAATTSAKTIVKNNAVAAITPAAAAPIAQTSKERAWCTYLREDTAAQTAIMRSPSINGALQDDGKAALSVGISLTDLGKANVVEQSAEARCRKYLSESGLQKLVFLSPQGLTSAGYKAKASAILSKREEIRHLRNKAEALMRNGDLTREKAAGLTALADSLLVEASEAKSQADRRTGDFLGAKDRASVLGRELLRAEADLEDLNSRLRTFDAMDVSVSAGWSDDVTRSGIDAADPNFSGKVSFSVKLGALNPQRFAHEERAKEAKLKAIRDEEGGALWQINVLRLAHERAIEGLEQSRAKLEDSIATANRLVAELQSVPNPEFAGSAISARLQLLRLQADKAAVSGSLAEIRANLDRLNTKS